MFSRIFCLAYRQIQWKLGMAPGGCTSLTFGAHLQSKHKPVLRMQDGLYLHSFCTVFDQNYAKAVVWCRNEDCLSRSLLTAVGWDYVASLRFPFLRGPSAIMKQKRPSAALRPRFFALHRTYESRLSTVRHSTKKALNFRWALLLCRDSVGIRTQDPQLRRLLLYPAELPNQSLFRSESGCKDREYFVSAKIYLRKVYKKSKLCELFNYLVWVNFIFCYSRYNLFRPCYSDSYGAFAGFGVFFECFGLYYNFHGAVWGVDEG